MTSNFQNYHFNQPNVQQQPIQNIPMQQYTQPNIFLQPVGNLFSLNTASDINNVPAGANVSVGLCLSENLMYIKSFQNGAPMLLGYRLTPIEGTVSSSGSTEDLAAVGALKDYEDRLSRIEDQILKIREKLGGKIEWQV